MTQDEYGKFLLEGDSDIKNPNGLLSVTETNKKCRKGHSYRPDLNRTEKKYSDEGLTLVRKWTCVKCGRHMENK